MAQKKTVLVTGAAGFIGAALCSRLLREDPDVFIIGLDDFNDYYDVHLKESRAADLLKLASEKKEEEKTEQKRFMMYRGSVTDAALLEEVFSKHRPAYAVHLAAQCGVRYSIEQPERYIETNITGFFRILEMCRKYRENGEDKGLRHLVYASSSSVYGSRMSVPFKTDDPCDRPVSLYAATKKADESLAYAYSSMYSIPMTGLRFFTVYGPAGRPDMFYFSTVQKLLAGEKIRLFNYGDHVRDFTYVDDITKGIRHVLEHIPEKKDDPDGMPAAPHSLYNIGGCHAIRLLEFLEILTDEMIREGLLPDDFELKDHCEPVPMQPGDVPVTCADCSPMEREFGFTPDTDLRDGLRKFLRWYRSYYIDGEGK